MRLRYALLSAVVASGTVLVPFAAPASAITTTSTLVAFPGMTTQDGPITLFTGPADGSTAPTPFPATAEVEVYESALSPDATKIAYITWDENAGADLLTVANVDGTGTPATILTGGMDDIHMGLTWSQDASKLALTRMTFSGDWETGGDIEITSKILVLPAAGGAATVVPGSGEDNNPSFSPSGTQIAVDDGLGISIVTLATGARAQVPGAEFSMDPAWSPDGQKLAVTAFGECNGEIATIPVTGGTLTTVRNAADRDSMSPTWSRDGSQLFWGESAAEPCTVQADTDAPADAGAAEALDGLDIWAAAADGSGAAAVYAAPTSAGESISVGGGPAAPADTTAPAAPVINASGTIAATSAKISWASSSADATEFKVVRVAKGAAAPATPADGIVGYAGPGKSATVSGLTTGTAYDLYVFAIDPSGNVSPPSAPHSARPTAPPVLASMGNVALLSGTNTFPVKWTGTAASYRVDVGTKTRSSSGVWATKPTYKVLTASTAAKSVSFTGAQGTSYFFQVKGMDGFGNTTAYSTAKSASVPLDERYYAASYSAGWTSASSAAGRWLGTVRYTTAAGKTMSGKFETSSFQVIGDKCSTCGKFEVWVDGVKKATIDSYATSTKTRQPLYTSGFYGSVTPHTIKIVTLGTAGHPRVGIDAIGLGR